MFVAGLNESKEVPGRRSGNVSQVTEQGKETIGAVKSETASDKPATEETVHTGTGETAESGERQQEQETESTEREKFLAGLNEGTAWGTEQGAEKTEREHAQADFRQEGRENSTGSASNRQNILESDNDASYTKIKEDRGTAVADYESFSKNRREQINKRTAEIRQLSDDSERFEPRIFGAEAKLIPKERLRDLVRQLERGESLTDEQIDDFF